MLKIAPNYQRLYDYDIDQDMQTITAKLVLPPGFDTNQVIVRVDQDDQQRYCIAVTIENQAPILAGNLYADIFPDPEIDTSHGSLSICLSKKSPKIWPTLISGKHGVTNDLDPKSAFFIYLGLEENGKDENDKKLAKESLEYSASFGLVRSIRVYAGLLLNDDDREEAIKALRVAADEYDDPQALCQLGNLLAYQANTRQLAFDYLLRASKLGLNSANSLLGQILSPLSDFDFASKNAEEAVLYLERACAGDEPNARALHELAKLTVVGKGTKKNISYGLKLQALAKDLNPEIPELNVTMEPDNNFFESNNLWILLCAAVVVTALGFGAYKNFKRRHQPK